MARSDKMSSLLFATSIAASGQTIFIVYGSQMQTQGPLSKVIPAKLSVAMKTMASNISVERDAPQAGFARSLRTPHLRRWGAHNKGGLPL